jgi:hypothetical protein
MNRVDGQAQMSPAEPHFYFAIFTAQPVASPYQSEECILRQVEDAYPATIPPLAFISCALILKKLGQKFNDEGHDMKRILMTIMVTAVWAATNTFAQGNLGIGAMAGEPTGLSLKNWFTDIHAADAGIGWSFTENDSFHLHADYLFHNYSLLPLAGGDKMPVYVGAGLRFKAKDSDGSGENEDDDMWGVRVPLGVSYLFNDYPIDLFAEIVPVFDFTPDDEFSLNGSLGARYYFR